MKSSHLLTLLRSVTCKGHPAQRPMWSASYVEGNMWDMWCAERMSRRIQTHKPSWGCDSTIEHPLITQASCSPLLEECMLGNTLTSASEVNNAHALQMCVSLFSRNHVLTFCLRLSDREHCGSSCQGYAVVMTPLHKAVMWPGPSTWENFYPISRSIILSYWSINHGGGSIEGWRESGKK